MDGMGWILSGIVVAAAGAWFVMRRRIEVACTIDLESTHDHFHAHVDLDGVELKQT